MVLPAPAAHALAGEAEPWCRRLIGLSGLTSRGVLVLVEAAQQHPLQTFVRAAAAVGLKLHLVHDVGTITEIPADAALVLCARPTDAEWLNRQRPLFAQRKLRVFLWVTNATAVALRERAPDFFDWISHHQQVPLMPPGFLRRGLALADAPGLLVEGTADDVRDLLQLCGAPKPLSVLDGRQHYPNLVASLRRDHSGWRVIQAIDGIFWARRARWALAQVDASGPLVLAGRDLRSPGWLRWSAETRDLFAATAELAASGVPSAMAVALACELEPAAVDLACRLATTWDDACIRALTTDDVGAALAILALARGLALPPDIQSSAPCTRARATTQLRKHTRTAAEACKRTLKRGSRCEPLELAAITAKARWTRPEPREDVAPVVRGWHIEALLRGGWHSSRAWLTYARVAGELAHHDVQVTWAVRGFAAPGADAQAEALLEQIVASADATDDPTWFLPMLLEALRDPRIRQEHGAAVRVYVRILLAWQATRRTAFADADGLLRDALADAEASGDPELEAEAYEALSDLAELRGDTAAASTWTMKMRALRPDAEPAQLTAEDRIDAMLARSEWSAAETAARAALSALSPRDPPARRGDLLERLADALAEQDRLAEAADTYAALREHLREHGAEQRDSAYLADASLADLWIHLGRLDEADALLRERGARLAADYGEDHLLCVLFDAAAVELQLARGDWAAAESAAHRLVATTRRLAPDSPDHMQALALLGRSLLRQGRAADALEPLAAVHAHWQTLRDDDLDDALDSLRDYADALASQGDGDGAEHILRELLAAVRAMPRGARRARLEFDAVIRLGRALMRHTKAQEAADLYFAALTDEPPLRRPLLLLASFTLLAAGHGERWEDMLRDELARREPNDAAWRTDAWYELASHCELQRRWPDAEAALRACLAEHPDEPMRALVLDRLHMLLRNLGRRDEAIAVLRDLLSRPLPRNVNLGDPTFHRRQLADLLLIQRDHAGAEAISDDPELAGPRMFALYKQGKDRELEQCARAVLDGPPTRWPEDALRARLFLALLDLERGHIEAARAVFRELSTAEAQRALGTTYSAKLFDLMLSGAQLLKAHVGLAGLIRAALEYQEMR